MYGKGFLGNMTENLQADCVQSRQAGFMQCFLWFGRTNRLDSPVCSANTLSLYTKTVKITRFL
jgi:hypothetical protein